MSERLQELEKIREEVKEDPENVPLDRRKYFWKLVRQIKRELHPDDSEIETASEIRNILFEVDRGKTYRTGPTLVLMTLIGIGSLLAYLWLLGTPLDWSNILMWSLGDLWNLFLRFLVVMGVVAFFYPWGRVIAGRILGIRIMGMCTHDYYEPAMKIDYVSFLKARPSNRKWFFFFAGLWTAITSIVVGVIGFIIAGDFTAFIPAILILLFEGKVIASGSAKRTSGEMGHYNREKKIERVWKKRMMSSKNQ